MEQLVGIGHALSIWFLPVVTAITLHEAAHGWAADRLGDDTARRLGRVSFNPLRHVDPVGTLVLPGLLLLASFFGGPRLIFGWARPVPVAFHRLRQPRRDMVLVALAGPAINIALAVVISLAMHLVLLAPAGEASLWVWTNLDNALLVNLVLACFNMLPIPPLDGGRVLTGLLPPVLARPFARIERFGILVVLALVFLLPMAGRRIGLELDLFRQVLLPVLDVVHGFILLITGW